MTKHRLDAFRINKAGRDYAAEYRREKDRRERFRQALSQVEPSGSFCFDPATPKGIAGEAWPTHFSQERHRG